MTRLLVCIGVASAGVWMVSLLFLGQAQEPPRTPTRRYATQEKHFVTPGQLSAAGALSARHIASFSALAHDGQQRHWPELARNRLTVLVFLKDGCSCNDDFEPYFQRLQRAYADHMAFVALIDAGQASAAEHATHHRVSYPVLCDPEKTLIRRFAVDHGGTVVLLQANGRIDTVWPGWSLEMFQQLGQRAAALAGVPEVPLDAGDLPHALTTGCPYSL